MSQKKLDKEIVETAIAEAFEKLPEDELIEQAIAKRLRLKGKPETREDTKKVLRPPATTRVWLRSDPRKNVIGCQPRFRTGWTGLTGFPGSPSDYLVLLLYNQPPKF